MFRIHGQSPEKIIGRALPFWLAPALLCLLSHASADSRLPLTLAEAEDLAMLDEPGEQMLRADAAANLEQSVAAGQLPDPTLRIGLANYPLGSGSFSSEGMTQAQLGVRQAFPRAKSRASDAARFRALSDASEQSAEARSREVIELTRQSWLELFYWQQARQLLQESRPFFEDLLSISRSMYAVGQRTQYDVLRAELELSRLDARIIDADSSFSIATASLSQWIGANATRPLAGKLPNWDGVPELAALHERLRRYPDISAAELRVAAQQAGVTHAEESKKPGWALDVGYGYREGYLPSGEPRSDFVSVAVVVDLPFFGAKRQDRRLSAALHARSAAVADKRRIEAELQSQLQREYVRWHELTRRIELYENEILGRMDDQAEAALLAYRSDAGSFSDLMLAMIDRLDTRLEHLRQQTDRAQSYASMANLGGLSR